MIVTGYLRTYFRPLGHIYFPGLLGDNRLRGEVVEVAWVRGVVRAVCRVGIVVNPSTEAEVVQAGPHGRRSVPPALAGKVVQV